MVPKDKLGYDRSTTDSFYIMNLFEINKTKRISCDNLKDLTKERLEEYFDIIGEPGQLLKSKNEKIEDFVVIVCN